ALFEDLRVRWRAHAFILWENSLQLAELDPVPIGREYGKLAHPPRLVDRRLHRAHAVSHQFSIQFVDPFDRNIDKVGMIARFARRHRIRALPEHQSESATREKRPPW